MIPEWSCSPRQPDWKCWKEGIVPTFSGYEHNYENTDILIASHHGSRSFFTDEELNENINEEDNPDSTYVESIRLIKPKITLISCGEYSVHHHPNKEALALYNFTLSHNPKLTLSYHTQGEVIFWQYILWIY